MSDWVTLQNALNLTLRPIDAWPGKSRYDREPGPFSAPLKDTLTTLKRELAALIAKNIVLQIAFRESDFRLDGLPRANAIATHPGVILTFDSKHGPLRFYFDRFTKWSNNLRAITMHLEHLRLAGLYGVGMDGQQYKGWQALPESADDDSTFLSAADAAEWVAAKSDVRGDYALPELRTKAYRTAAAILHPDNKQSGSHEMFVRLQQAKSVLEGRPE